MSASFAIALLALLGVAAWFDLSRRQIPNHLVGGAILLWLGAVAAGVAGPVWPSLAAASGVLLVGMAIWCCGWLGGGDVKLIAALSLWAGTEHLATLLLATALSGGLLASAAVIANRLALSPTMMLLQAQAGRLWPAAAMALSRPGAKPLPYGVAVALGGCWVVRPLFA